MPEILKQSSKLHSMQLFFSKHRNRGMNRVLVLVLSQKIRVRCRSVHDCMGSATIGLLKVVKFQTCDKQFQHGKRRHLHNLATF